MVFYDSLVGAKLLRRHHMHCMKETDQPAKY